MKRKFVAKFAEYIFFFLGKLLSVNLVTFLVVPHTYLHFNVYFQRLYIDKKADRIIDHDVRWDVAGKY